MRFLRLTSPLMRGQDVVTLQRAINTWAHTRHRTPLVDVDGEYGPLTEHAVGAVAYDMGLQSSAAIKDVQRLIEHPRLRSPMDLRRASLRQAATEKSGTGLAAVLSHAQSHAGVAENPPDSNWGEPEPAGWERNFGFQSGVSWCGCFAGSMILAAGGHVTSRVAYCPYIEQDAKGASSGFDRWTTDQNDDVEPGWLVLYDWTGAKSLAEHVGVVSLIGPSFLSAVEGNTSGTDPAAGGMVAVMSRPYELVVGFARPRF